jgi:hypothetical protein
MVMIYAEPGPEDLASFVPCFRIERNGYRIVASTFPVAEAVCVTEMALVHEGRQWKYRKAPL